MAFGNRAKRNRLRATSSRTSRTQRQLRLCTELLEDRRVLAVGDLLQSWSAPVGATSAAQFGTSVSTDGQHTIVGLPFHDVAGFASAGVAQVFDNQTGNLLATLPNPTPATFELHGFSVAISGRLAVVSTYRDGEFAASAGSVSVYDWSTSTLLRTIHQPQGVGNEQFGYAIDLDTDGGNWLVVGSRLDNAGVPGGKAYLFDPTTGSHLATMSNPSGQTGDFFGMSVSVDAGVSVVGAPTNDTGASNSGVAYLFDAAGKDRKSVG